MKQSLKDALKQAHHVAVKGAGHRFVGFMLFCALCTASLVFCVWFKSLWNEPLGLDGLALSFVLSYIVYKAIPIIDRLISK
ncbi:hypothetical protein [Paraburkholderia sp. J8-2]|uniref:hypothetical protein n=1 Tax=Paraburkholderia sp. J8-2 TaxID=2805440 RepID=UPI002AB622BE|nr:hypothetical protein [Paraburkholderia sp. J8-2]